jgi:hypothetical protein
VFVSGILMSTAEAAGAPNANHVRQHKPPKALFTKAALILAQLFDDIGVEAGMRAWLIGKIPCQLFEDVAEGEVPEDSESIVLSFLAGGGAHAVEAVAAAAKAAMSRRSWFKEKAFFNIRERVAAENEQPVAPAVARTKRAERPPTPTTPQQQQDTEEEEEEEQEDDSENEPTTQQAKTTTMHKTKPEKPSFYHTNVLQDPALWKTAAAAGEDDRDLRLALQERFLGQAKAGTWARAVAEAMIRIAVLWAQQPLNPEIPTIALDNLERTKVYFDLGPLAAEKFAATVRSEQFSSRYARAARQAEKTREKEKLRGGKAAATTTTTERKPKETKPDRKEAWIPKAVFDTLSQEQKDKFFEERKKRKT